MSKEKINDIFPNESYTRSLELIDKIKRLVPLNKDKVPYLETLINYVDSLINGDDLHQFSTYQYVSKYAKEALSEIMNEVHSQILESYRLERMNLQNEVSELSIRRNNLYSQVESLQGSKGELVRETGCLSIELDKLSREILELKQNGFRKAEEEVASERNRLSNLINSLNNEKNTLTTTIGELKDIVDNYNKTISKLDEKEEEISWEPIREDSPVYSLNTETIDLYLNSLIEEYIAKTGEPEEKVKNIFRIKCQELYTISDILQKSDQIEINRQIPIRTIINNAWNHLYDYNIALDTKNALSTIKLPVYKKKRKNVDSLGLTKDTISININVMLRELYLQRVATEAITRQRILESELEVVVGILKSVVGPDYDFSNLIMNDDILAKLLSNKDDSSTLKLQ